MSISRGMIKESISYYCYIWLIVGHDKNKINRLKKELGRKFAMKDLGLAQQILGMRIMHDRKKKVVAVTRKIYQEGA